MLSKTQTQTESGIMDLAQLYIAITMIISAILTPIVIIALVYIRKNDNCC